MKTKHVVFLIIVAIICFVNVVTTSDLVVGIVNSIALIAIAILFFVLIRYPDFEDKDTELIVIHPYSETKLQEKKDVSAIQD